MSAALHVVGTVCLVLLAAWALASAAAIGWICIAAFTQRPDMPEDDYQRAVPLREDTDADLMAIADAVQPLDDWQMWEAEMKETAR